MPPFARGSHGVSAVNFFIQGSTQLLAFRASDGDEFHIISARTANVIEDALQFVGERNEVAPGLHRPVVAKVFQELIVCIGEERLAGQLVNETRIIDGRALGRLLAGSKPLRIDPEVLMYKPKDLIAERRAGCLVASETFGADAESDSKRSA